MNDQPTTPNLAGGGEVPKAAQPENLQGAPAASEAPRPEAAPAPGPGAAAPQQSGSAASVPPTLSSNDVAAAIAAVPGPSGPGGVSGMPTTADDVDVIEPEWVNKAEEVVHAHAGDPHGEEEAVEELQEDYLQKRYGYNVADPNKGDSGTSGKPEGA